MTVVVKMRLTMMRLPEDQGLARSRPAAQRVVGPGEHTWGPGQPGPLRSRPNPDHCEVQEPAEHVPASRIVVT